MVRENLSKSGTTRGGPGLTVIIVATETRNQSAGLSCAANKVRTRIRNVGKYAVAASRSLMVVAVSAWLISCMAGNTCKR
jgi:hypothetical protein